MLFAFAFFSVWFLEGCLCMTHSNMTIFYWFHNTLDSLLMGTTPSNAFTLDYFNNLCAKGNCAGALFSLGRVYFASVLDNGTGTTCWGACGRCPVWNTFLNVSSSFFLCKTRWQFPPNYPRNFVHACLLFQLLHAIISFCPYTFPKYLSPGFAYASEGLARYFGLIHLRGFRA